MILDDKITHKVISALLTPVLRRAFIVNSLSELAIKLELIMQLLNLDSKV
jgi:hypothetical protein